MTGMKKERNRTADDAVTQVMNYLGGNKIVTGSSSVAGSGSKYADFTLSYGYTFSSTPSIIVITATGGTNAYKMLFTVNSKAVSSASCRCFNTWGDNFSNTITFDFQVIGPK